ncbi:MAG: carboxypeptidase regulatory-like domain-containing protein, partial [Gemmatimonadetes bacterium]|nr:carboxypeptidase regulatory-like domain-containing protein [Gemmatimonadota bacterium]
AGAIAVQPGPNRYRIVDLPVVPGGVIDGEVIRADGTGAPGVTLVLRHLETGDERTVTSFSDGEFYVMGVRSGEYELSVAPASAERLGVVATPLRFTMRADADGGSVAGLVVTLR